MIERLKEIKKQVTNAIEQVDLAQKDLEQTKEWQTVENAKIELNTLQNQLKQIDQHVRLAAIEAYEQNGNKTLWPGVTVIINKKVFYEVGLAIEWAINNSVDMLKLDIKKFDKHARAVAGTVPLSFIEIKEVLAVRIAKNLWEIEND